MPIPGVPGGKDTRPAHHACCAPLRVCLGGAREGVTPLERRGQSHKAHWLSLNEDLTPLPQSYGHCAEGGDGHALRPFRLPWSYRGWSLLGSSRSSTSTSTAAVLCGPCGEGHRTLDLLGQRRQRVSVPRVGGG